MSKKYKISEDLIDDMVDKLFALYCAAPNMPGHFTRDSTNWAMSAAFTTPTTEPMIETNQYTKPGEANPDLMQIVYIIEERLKAIMDPARSRTYRRKDALGNSLVLIFARDKDPEEEEED